MTQKTTDKVKAKTETKEATTAVVDAKEKLTEATKSVGGIFQAMATGSKLAFKGVIEVDKALLGHAGEAFKSYTKLARESVGMKSASELLDLHVAYAHDRIEQNAANAREVLELSRTKAKEAYTPVQEALAPYMPSKEETA